MLVSWVERQKDAGEARYAFAMKHRTCFDVALVVQFLVVASTYQCAICKVRNVHTTINGICTISIAVFEAGATSN